MLLINQVQFHTFDHIKMYLQYDVVTHVLQHHKHSTYHIDQHLRKQYVLKSNNKEEKTYQLTNLTCSGICILFMLTSDGIFTVIRSPSWSGITKVQRWYWDIVIFTYTNISVTRIILKIEDVQRLLIKIRKQFKQIPNKQRIKSKTNYT